MNIFQKILNNSRFERYFLFIINVYIFHIYGVLSGSFGITLIQIGKVLQLTTVELSIGLSAQAIFGCVASLLATYTLDKWNRNLQYAFDVLFLSIVIILFPFSNSSAEYLFYSAAIGFFTSVINCINTIWTVELFRDNPSFFIQVLFFFYPLGATFSRILFSPFLDNSDLIATSNRTLSYEISNLPINQTSTHEFTGFLYFFNNVNKTYIWIPYLIVGILMMIGSLVLFLLHFCNPFKNALKRQYTIEINNNELVANQSGDSKIDSTECKAIKSIDGGSYSMKLKAAASGEEHIIPYGRSPRRHKFLSFVFVILVCIIVTLQVGCEINFVNFVPTFLTKLTSYDFDETEASYISIILTGCVTLGRFVNIFLSLKIETEFMIYVNFVLMLAGNLILIFLSHITVELIWVAISLIGLGYSSTYPLILAFVEKRYLMSNSLSSLLEFSCLFFVCFSPIAFGHILDSMPNYFIYINTFTNIVLLVLFSCLHFMGSFRKSV